MGEALVKEYFEFAGWTVVRSGIESVGPQLLRHGEVDAGELATMPDLLLVKTAGSATNPSTHGVGQALYVEVKTWRDWAHAENLERYRKFGTVLLVWVSPRGLLGAWLTRPDGAGSPRAVRDPARVVADDFGPLETVGALSLRHCAERGCESVLREKFHAMAARTASA